MDFTFKELIQVRFVWVMAHFTYNSITNQPLFDTILVNVLKSLIFSFLSYYFISFCNFFLFGITMNDATTFLQEVNCFYNIRFLNIKVLTTVQ